MLRPGDRLGSYEVVRTLGAGGMAIVYEARHTVLGTRAALKLLLPNLAASEKVRTRFVQEGYIQHELIHPNIVRVLDAVDSDGWLGLALEFIDGPSLEEALGELYPGPWGVVEVRAVLTAVLAGMAHAHARGVVHRDLKPGNVLVPRRADGSLDLAGARVTDFGIAKVLSTDAAMTRTNAQMGTVPYMAPEQYKGARDADARADVFALGMMAWRMLAGTLPVAPEDMSSVHELYAGKSPIPAITTIRPDVQPDLAGLVDAALRVDVHSRPADAGVLAAALGATSVPFRAPASGAIPAAAPTHAVRRGDHAATAANGGAQRTAPATVLEDPPAVAPTSRAPLAVGVVALVLVSAGVGAALVGGSGREGSGETQEPSHTVSDRAAAEPAGARPAPAPAAPRPSAPAPAPTPTASPTPPAADRASVERAVRTAVDGFVGAYNRGDLNAYVSHVANPADCWRGQRNFYRSTYLAQPSGQFRHRDRTLVVESVQVDASSAEAPTALIRLASYRDTRDPYQRHLGIRFERAPDGRYLVDHYVEVESRYERPTLPPDWRTRCFE